MNAYYNEVDPQAAQWLRNLIAAGHIAPGDVDNRSIVEVQPDDIRKYTQCHFFAGIGVWSYALRRAGWYDKRRVWTGSCPCQPFSAAGKRGGVDDERHLWPEWFRLIRECRPDVIFGEQVSSKDALTWVDHVSVDLEGAGYAVGAVDTCAAGFGAPHIRQRLYFVAHSLLAGWSQRRSVPWDGPLTRCSGVSSVTLAHSERGAAERHGYAVAGAPGAPAGGKEERERLRDDAGDGCDALDVGVAQGDADGQRRDGFEVCLFERGPQQDRAEVAGSSGFGSGAVDHTPNARHHHPGQHGSGSPLLATRPLKSSAVGGVGPMADSDGARSAVGFSGPEHGEEGYAGVVDHGCGEEPSTGHGPASCAVPGPVNGFWADAEWIPCRDGKARPVEPGPQQMVDGSASCVGRVRAEDITQIEEEINAWALRHSANPGETLRNLWYVLRAQALHDGATRGSQPIFAAPILLAFLRQLTDQGWRFTNALACTRTEASRIVLQPLWLDQEVTRSPHGRKLEEQHTEQPPDALRELSQIVARNAESTWGETCRAYATTGFPLITGAPARVVRLRAYGNAINSEAAKEFIAAYMSLT